MDSKNEKIKVSIKLNFIMNAILTMSSIIFPLLTFPYVSRILLPEGTGKVSLATSIVSYFTLFAQLGIPTYGVRTCAKVRDDRTELTRTAHELLFINIIMTVISYVAFVLALIFVPKMQEERTLYIIVSFSIILTSIGMDWLYRALEQYTYITVRSIAFKFIALIGMFMLIHEKKDYVIYGGITIFASCASNIMNLINAHKYIDFHRVGNYNIKRHVKAIGVFFAMACATTIYTHLDTVMLGFIKTDDDVGYYNAAVKIKVLLVSIVTSLGTVLLPRVSYYVENKRIEDFKRISAKALNFVFLVATPLMVYFILFAKQGIFFLSGDEYKSSILPMQIIMPTLIFIGITNILGIQILVPLGKEKTVLYSEIAGMVVDLVLNALLIPKYASAGAAVGTVCAEAMVLIFQYFSIKDEIGEVFGKISYIRIISSIAIGTVASIWIPMLEIEKNMGTTSGNFIVLAITGVLFFGFYFTGLLLFKEKLTTELLNQQLLKIKRRK